LLLTLGLEALGEDRQLAAGVLLAEIDECSFERLLERVAAALEAVVLRFQTSRQVADLDVNQLVVRGRAELVTRAVCVWRSTAP
jgi:hypothetical protein